MLAKFRNAPVYLMLLATFAPAATEKFLGREVPVWFLKQFGGSLLDAFPGSLSLSFYLIACMEAASAIALVISLARREFLPGNPKTVTLAALLLSELTFISLGIGQRITHQFDGAFQLFAYAALTFLAGTIILKGENGAPLAE